MLHEFDESRLNIDLPVKDYGELTLKERLKYDKRPYKKYLGDMVLSGHIMLNIFFLNSLLIPRYLRTIKCLCVMSFMFGF